MCWLHTAHKLLQLSCLYKQIGFPWLKAQLEAPSMPCCCAQLLDFKEKLQVPWGNLLPYSATGERECSHLS